MMSIYKSIHLSYSYNIYSNKKKNYLSGNTVLNEKIVFVFSDRFKKNKTKTDIYLKQFSYPNIQL